MIFAVKGCERGMGTHFGYLAFVHHHYLVGLEKGGEAVCHHYYRFAMAESGEVVCDDPLIVAVKGFGGFVQKDKHWVFVDYSGDQYSLALSALIPCPSCPVEVWYARGSASI